MPSGDVRDTTEALRDLIGLPSWAPAILLVIFTLSVSFRPLSELLTSMQRLARNYLIPLFYTPEKRARVQDRRIFADHVESEIRRYNAREDWSDHRFAELEAEVEVQDSHWGLGILSRMLPTGAVRREKSLTRALRYSADRQILLVGDPGSGKSVALRHLPRRNLDSGLAGGRLSRSGTVRISSYFRSL
jgi:hypothetical protein